MTDYPDRVLVDNIAQNVVRADGDAHVAVLEYVWGRAVKPIL